MCRIGPMHAQPRKFLSAVELYVQPRCSLAARLLPTAHFSYFQEAAGGGILEIHPALDVPSDQKPVTSLCLGGFCSCKQPVAGRKVDRQNGAVNYILCSKHMFTVLCCAVLC